MSGWGNALGAWNNPRSAPSVTEGTRPPPAGAELSEVDLSQGSPATSLAAREAAVARREAALAAKEKELSSREAERRRNGGGPKKNWPVCFPFIRHDIASDIPQHLQGMIRQTYWSYLVLVLCLVFNFAGACAMMGTQAEDRMSSFFLSAIYLIAGTPAALVGWYLKLYNAAASDGALGYLSFFIMYCIHTAFCVWAAVAVPMGGERWSFTGFVSAMRAFDVNKGVAVVFLIGACFWTLEALWSFWCLKSVYFTFRSGAKQQQAHSEMQRMALKAAMDNRS